MYSEKYNFIFMHVPKAAGNSIIKALHSYTAAKCHSENPYLVEFMSKKNILFPNHAPACTVKEAFGEEKFKKAFKFAFVRNPWDWLVSMYHYNKFNVPDIFKKLNMELDSYAKQICNSNSFLDWIDKQKWLGNPQSHMLTIDNKISIDYIGRVEFITKDFSYLCKKLGIPQLAIERHNISIHDDYRKYYNDSAIKKVEDFFYTDIALFGYKFDTSQHAITNHTFCNEQAKIIYSHLNKWCEIKDPAVYNLLLHPNEVGNPPSYIEFCDLDLSQIKALRFEVVADNPSPQNPGANLVCEIRTQSAIVARQEIELLPQQEQEILLSIIPHHGPHSVCFIASNRKGATSHFCTRINIHKANILKS